MLWFFENNLNLWKINKQKQKNMEIVEIKI